MDKLDADDFDFEDLDALVNNMSDDEGTMMPK